MSATTLQLFQEIDKIAAKAASVQFKSNNNIGLGYKIRAATKSEINLFKDTKGTQAAPQNRRRSMSTGRRRSLGLLNGSNARMSLASHRASMASTSSARSRDSAESQSIDENDPFLVADNQAAKKSDHHAQKKKVIELFKAMDEIVEQCSLGLDDTKKVEDMQNTYKNLQHNIRHLKNTINDYSEHQEENIEERTDKQVDTRRMEMEVEEKQMHVESLQQKLQRREQQIQSLDQEQRAQSERRKTNAERALELNELEQKQMDVEAKTRKAQHIVDQNQKELDALQSVLHSARLASPNSNGSQSQQSISPEVQQQRIAEKKQEFELLKNKCSQLQETIASRMQEKQELRDNDPKFAEFRSQLQQEEKIVKESQEKMNTLDSSCNKMQNLIAHLVQVQSAENNPMALVLQILKENQGEMLLKDLKSTIGERINGKSTSKSVKSRKVGAQGSKVLQIIYSAVANGLIKIDRTHVENTVISMVQF